MLTSLGWDNTFTHANPGLTVTALATGDPTVRVLTPSDSARTAAALLLAATSRGSCSLIVKGKHTTAEWPLDTIDKELGEGHAIWPWLSDAAPADVVLVGAGDLAVREMASAAASIRDRRPKTRLRFVAVHDLTCLGHPSRWPSGITETAFDDLFPPGTPVLAATVTGTETLRMLLWDRPDPGRFRLRGYSDPGRPLPAHLLLKHCRMDAESLAADALNLLAADRVLT